jgi:hypothetical protein
MEELDMFLMGLLVGVTTGAIIMALVINRDWGDDYEDD